MDPKTARDIAALLGERKYISVPFLAFYSAELYLARKGEQKDRRECACIVAVQGVSFIHLFFCFT